MSIDFLVAEGPVASGADSGAELLTEGIKPAIKMNSQQKKVNDYRLLSQAVIDLRLALLFMFIDAIVYLFGGRRHFTFSVWHDKIRQSLEPVVWSQ